MTNYMKLLLIRPYYGININSDMSGDLGIAEYKNQIFPDVSFLYAGTIASIGCEAHILDANAEKVHVKDIIKHLWNFYDEIIIKACAPTITYDLKFALYLKRFYPNSKITIAGHIVHLLKEYLKANYSQFNFLFNISLESYVYQITNSNQNNISLKDYPPLDYSLFPYKNYTDVSDIVRGCLYLSRGCVQGCLYCPYASFYENKMEFREVETVINEIKKMIDLGITTIQFRDQFFTWNKEIVIKFCKRLIEENIHINWRCETRLEGLSKELIDLMVKSGLEMICFGVESANMNTFKKYKRQKFDYEKIEEVIKRLKDNNVITMAFYIIGFPDDSWEEIQNTFDLSIALQTDHVKYSVYYPYREIIEAGIKLEPYNFIPFENETTLFLPKNLKYEEMKFLENHLILTYSTLQQGLYDTYKYHYSDILDYKNEKNNANLELNNWKWDS